jgi:hypothetical protein
MNPNDLVSLMTSFKVGINQLKNFLDDKIADGATGGPTLGGP